MIKFKKLQNINKCSGKYKIIFFIIFYIVLLSSVNAQDFWQQTNGPEGGSVPTLLINANGDLLAGVYNGGIFRSVSNGDNWMPLALNNIDIFTLEMDTTNRIYAGTGEGVFRSENNGIDWSSVNTGLTNMEVRDITININNFIFAGTWGDGVFRSDNFGDNWIQVNNGLSDNVILSLAASSVGHIFAGTYQEGVFRSTDNGDNWTQINNGLTEMEILSLAINRVTGTIFAGTADGVFRSIDSGNNWTQVNNGLNSTYIISLFINPSDDVFAGTPDGLFRSNNNGDDWTTIINGLTNDNVNSFCLKGAGLLFAGTNGGVFRSGDNGDNWSQVNSGLIASEIVSLAINRTGEIFAGTDGAAIFRSNDNGISWVHSFDSINPFVLSLVINSSGHIFAGTYDGVFRSVDNGNSWTQINTNLTSSDVYTLAINSNDHIFAGTYDGVFRSMDNGNNWEQINSGLTRSNVNSLVINKDNLVFAGCDSGGLYRSTDNGDNWTLVNNGLTNTDILDITVRADNVLFAGSWEGVYRSGDNGNNWFQVNNGLTSTDVFALVTDFRDRIYAGTYEGVFVSGNNGDNWNPRSSGLTNFDIFSLSLHPAGFLFAGSYGAGVFKSTDRTSLAIPELITPHNGMNNVNIRPLLRWYAVEGAASYEVQVDEEATFSSLDWSNTVTDTIVQTDILDPEKTYYWRVNAIDGINTSFWSEMWNFTTLALPILTIQGATNISDVSATLNGEVNPNGHTIAVGFEYGDDNSYGTYASATPDTFNGTVNQFVYAEVNRLRTNWDYHFRVVVNQVDGAFTVHGDDQTFHTQSYPTNIDLSANIQFPSYDNPSDYGAAEYRLFGLPGRKDSQLDIANILSGDHKITWQAYWDNGTYSDNSNDYLIEFDGSENFMLGDGNAIWLLNKGNFDINITGLQTMSTDGDDNVRINLHNGWNLITCPFTRQVPWWAIQQINSIANPVYEFNGGWNTSEHLNPYNGYIFDNTNNLFELIVPYGATLPKPSLNNEYDWRIKIALHTRELLDNSSYIGVSELSEIGKDDFDFRKPYAVGSVPSVYFERAKWDNNHSSYATDIRPPISEIENWNFSVSAIPGEHTELIFNEVADVPTNFEVVLLDRANTKYVDLRIDNSYQFIPVTEITKFEILVGDKKYIDQEITAIIPLEFSISENFPNPFNPSTLIPVSIPNESELTLKVYNILGQEINTIFRGTKETGKHYFKWDGTNYLNQQVAAGIYLYRLNTNQGHTFVGKMVLVK